MVGARGAAGVAAGAAVSGTAVVTAAGEAEGAVLCVVDDTVAATVGSDMPGTATAPPLDTVLVVVLAVAVADVAEGAFSSCWVA